ncbi:MAG: tRNA (adenosine(37)-N6)-threonylcarbamoyltransferase complex dimerization subunit type 1 TsaB [Candidatus Nanopelagicaceae bacterium]|nr:tRNA (adenosine(37)-N6)-threonylcarbamoyltransferase complex dimerization subunit type 1 TsaB [Candidatus Nanopelagicaceae bacterium]
MKTVLAIDTSTAQTSVALIQDGEVLFNKSHNDPLAHGEVLPKLVSQALAVNNKVDLVAVGMGPGPFTGLRVGIAFAQSYALATQIDWVGVCSLDAMAAGINQSEFIVSTDARRKERFWARYKEGVRITDPAVSKASELEKLGLPILTEGDYFPDPVALAKIALTSKSVEQPIYIRKPDAYPLPIGVKFRPMSALDLVSATAIEKQVYGKTAWSADQFKSEFAKSPKSARYLAAEFEGQLIAYAGIFYVADVADIHTLTVVADHRRKGIGRELLKRLIDWARVKKAQAIMLEMRLGNDAARPLYESFGFIEISKRENYYGPGLTAVVMRKELR